MFGTDMLGIDTHGTDTPPFPLTAYLPSNFLILIYLNDLKASLSKKTFIHQFLVFEAMRTL